MAAVPTGKKSERAMTSPVYWALLGLVIERPSYGFELHNRYERRYGDVLPVSAQSHVYAALTALEKRGLVELVPGVGEGRQPKPHYRATSSGLDGYKEWLVAQADGDRRRQELWVRQLGVFARDPGAALHVLGRVEREYLKGAGDVGRPPSGVVARTRDELIDGLIAEQQRITVGGMLSWLRHARAHFEARARGTGRDEPSGT